MLDGDGDANTLNGGKGNDVLIGRGGADKLIGGGGIDTVNYAASAGGIGVALAFHLGSGGDATGDRLFGIENVIGSAFEDEIAGNGIANRLSGGKGDDLLAGRGGRDILTGGAGADHFLFDVNPDGSNNIVRITDFVHAIDKIELEPVNFQALGLTFTPDEFRIGAAAKDASDRIIYNPVTGALIYDFERQRAGSCGRVCAPCAASRPDAERLRPACRLMKLSGESGAGRANFATCTSSPDRVTTMAHQACKERQNSPSRSLAVPQRGLWRTR